MSERLAQRSAMFVATALCLAVATLVPVTPAVAADRSYELVTPAGTGAYRPQVIMSGADGDRVLYEVQGTGGSPAGAAEDAESPDLFLALRGTSAWDTTWLTNYAPLHGFVDIGAQLPQAVLSENGSRAVFSTSDGVVPADGNRSGDLDFTGQDLFARDVTPSGFTLLTHDQGGASVIPGIGGGQTFEMGASADLSTVVFTTSGALVPGDTDGQGDVYTWHDGTVSLVSTGNGSPTNGPFAARLATESSLPRHAQNAVSADGSHIFLVTAESLVADDTDTSEDVYLRSGGVTTLLSDRHDATPDPAQPAAFIAASKSGDVAYVSTAEPLVTADSNGIDDIYRVDTQTGAAQLVTDGQASVPPSPVAVSPDGSHVFFISAASLATGAPADGSPKLYEWHGGTTTLVAALDPSDVATGGGSRTLDQPTLDARPARSSPDGTLLVFESHAALDGADQDGGHADVYGWRQGQALTLVSRGGDGALDARIGMPLPVGGGLSGAVIANEGAEIYFTSPEALTPAAGDNGNDKVYEFANGVVSLISAPGNGAGPARYLGNSANGRDVFINTADALVPSDADGGAEDIYDARQGGGLPTPPTGGSGIGGPAPSGGPGEVPNGPPLSSSSAQPTESAQPPAPPAPPLATAALVEHSASIDGRGAGVELRLSGPGTVTVTLQAPAARRAAGDSGQVLGTGSRTVEAAGSVSVPIRLTPVGTRLVRRAGRVRLRLQIRFDSAGGATTTRTPRVTLVTDRITLLPSSVRRTHGTLRARLAVPSAGRLTLDVRRSSTRSRRLARAHQRVRRGGQVSVTMRETRAGRRLQGRHRVQFDAAFTARDGSRLTLERRVTIGSGGSR